MSISQLVGVGIVVALFGGIAVIPVVCEYGWKIATCMLLATFAVVGLVAFASFLIVGGLN